MPGPEPLAVYLGGAHVAILEEVRTRRLALTYADAAFAGWPLNAPVLSVALPLRPGRLPPGSVGPFFEGLLPEGEARSTIESRFGVRRGDRYGLLRAIGRDCAGAVVVQPADAPPPTEAQGTLQPLTDGELDAAVRLLPERPLGADDRVRLSLGGQQDKLLLGQLPDGRWARPLDGRASTHILKPEDARYPGMAVNEAFCMRLAAELGLTSVEVEVLDVAGRPVLAVSRFDRRETADGRVLRVHQEDMCQALSVDVSRGLDVKYEEWGGPSLRQVAGVLDAYAGGYDALLALVDVVVLTVVVGNADAHGRNLALLHEDGVTLAPVYDVISTVEYPTVPTPDGVREVSSTLAMRVNGRGEIEAVTVADIVAEASSWGIVEHRAADRVAETLERALPAVDAAEDATPEAPSRLADRVRGRAQALLDGRPAGDA